MIDVNENIRPFWLTDMLGTKKQYFFVLLFLIIYIGCTYICISAGLLEMSDMVVEDYFDRSDIFTQIMFTDREIRNQFTKNKDYVTNFIMPWNFTEFDKDTFSH